MQPSPLRQDLGRSLVVLACLLQCVRLLLSSTVHLQAASGKTSNIDADVTDV